MSHPQRGGLPAVAAGVSVVERAIDEALGSVMSPVMRRKLLAKALQRAGRWSLPLDAEALVEFVEGPLGATIVDALGAAMAEPVIGELRTLALRTSATQSPRATSGTRRAAERTAPRSPDSMDASSNPTIPEMVRPLAPVAPLRPRAAVPRPSLRPTMRPPAVQAAVVLVSADAGLRVRFSVQGAAVIAVSNLSELCDVLGAVCCAKLVVMIDARMGVPCAAIPLDEIVPRACRVIVWGRDPGARASELGLPVDTVWLGHATNERELSALSRRMLGV
jgi:hypothetical protein